MGGAGGKRRAGARLAWAGLLSGTTAAAAWAQVEPRELTAEQSVRLGLERNASVRAVRADADAARALWQQARAARLPSIASQASYTRLSDNIPGVEFTLPGTDSTVTFQAVQLNRYHVELNVEQSLLPMLRVQHEVAAARHYAEAAALRVEQEEAEVAYRIRTAYWDLYRFTAVSAAMDAALARVDEHLRDVQNRFGAGTALNRDVLSARTRVAEVRLERVAAANAARVAQLELNRLLGLPLDETVSLAAAPTVDVTMTSLDAATAAAVAGRPQLRALAEEASARRAELRAVQGERLPDLSFIGRYIHARPNPYFFTAQDRFHRTWELGVNARWSIWNGGRQDARAAEARARVETAEARLAEAREQIAVEVARQHLEVLRTAEAVDAAAQNVAAAAESYRVARQQFEEGAAPSTEVLDAEEAFRRAEARSADAVASHAIARAALLNVLGRAW